MISDFIMTEVSEMLNVVSEVGGALMIPPLLIGLSIAVFQAATQINEQSLPFVAKVVAIFFILTFYGMSLIHLFLMFFERIFEKIPTIAL